VNSQDPMREMPNEARGWHWGAFGFELFGLGWIWALNHNLRKLAVLLALPFCLKIGLGLVTHGMGLARPFGALLSWIEFGLALYLGRAGSVLAWANREFDDLEEFKECRRIWGWWALGLTVVATVVLVASIAFFAWLDSQR
jgi:hypothetical protein